MAEQPYERLSYADVLALLNGAAGSEGAPAGKAGGAAVEWGDDLSSEQEKWVCATAGEGRPVFVTRYPASLKPFYMLQEDDSAAGEEGAVVGAFDLLVPGVGELVGGSAREHREGRLLAAMGAAGLLDDAGGAGALEWYVDLRRFGSVPHAGYGIGFERLVQFATGMTNIRDVIPVPRAPGMCRM